MNKIRRGSTVIKKSDNRRIVFIVDKIASEHKQKVAILKGLYIRIIEKIPLSELKIVDRKYINHYIEEKNKSLERRIYSRIMQGG